MSVSFSHAASLVSARNANNANHPSWESGGMNAGPVSHTVSVFDKNEEMLKK